jgi:integrase
MLNDNDFTNADGLIKDALKNYPSTLDDTDILDASKHIVTRLLQQEEYVRQKAIDGDYNLSNPSTNPYLQKLANNTKTPIKHTNTHQTNNLQHYVNEFLESALTELSNSIDAISLRETALKSLLLEFGGMNVKDITLKDLKEYREKLNKLPSKSLAKDNKLYKDCASLSDIIDLNNKLKKEVITSSTVNKYLRIIKNFFKFLNDNEYINKNIAENLTNIKSTLDTSTDDTLEFSNDDLEIIFNAEFYTTKLNYNVSKKIEKVFAPIIALYSGMRLNELSSLHIEDIKIKNGIYYFDINNEKDKTVKNKASIRSVPIHQKIIDAGFIEYIHKLPHDKSIQVWGNLTKKIKNDKTGKVMYGTTISTWFGNYKKGLGFGSRKKVFHSFRHNAINNLKQQRINATEIAQIVGHSNNSITIDRYGEAYSVESLAGVVNKIHYDVPALHKLIPKLKELIIMTDFNN